MSTKRPRNVKTEDNVSDANKLEEAKKKLEKLRKDVNSSNPAKGEIPKNVQQLSPSKDAREIKYFSTSRINNGIKDNFKHDQELAPHLLKLKKTGPTGSGTEVGKIWHKILKNYIDNPSQNSNEVSKAVIDSLKEKFNGIEFLQSEFPLYGYMVHKEDRENSLWNGNADAIGWYNNNYVIVDWKAVDLLDFWTKNKHAYGDYLHQCLVYARLLQLHLDLEKLPYILIVPINNKSGEEIHPGLFRDFPKDCKDELAKYEWSKESKLQTLNLKKTVVKKECATSSDGIVKNDTPVRDVLKEDITVKDLLNALHVTFSELKIVD